MYIKQFQVPTVTVLVTYSFSTIIDEAPPPPLQMAATPFCPGLRAWTRCRTMRAPDILQLNHNFVWKITHCLCRFWLRPQTTKLQCKKILNWVTLNCDSVVIRRILGKQVVRMGMLWEMSPLTPLVGSDSPNGVPQAHSPTMDICFAWVNLQRLEKCHHNNTECLIHFPQCHIILLHSTPFQQLQQNNSDNRECQWHGPSAYNY